MLNPVMNKYGVEGVEARKLTANPMSLAAAGVAKMVAAMTRQPTRGSLGERAELLQPQDGETRRRAVRAKVASIKPRSSDRLAQESEDAVMTGGTRSLSRRLMGLNFGKVRSIKGAESTTEIISQPKVA